MDIPTLPLPEPTPPGRTGTTVSVTAFRTLVAVVAVLVVAGVAAVAFLSGKKSSDQAAPAVTTAVVPVVAPVSTSPAPVAVKPSAKPKASTKTVYVKPKATRHYGNGFSVPYGTFTLTGNAYPGPIHAYAEPTDQSAELYPIYPYDTVTVYCFVRGQRLNGHDYWDWTGDGWVWDQMVDIGGHSPPACDGDY